MGQLNSRSGQKGERRTGEKSIQKATGPDQWDIAHHHRGNAGWNVALVLADDGWNLP